MKNLKSKLIFCIIIISVTSCSKRIEGNIIDNFGSAIDKVNITIENSDFNAESSNGKFSLDYTPGKIKIIFAKEGYSTVNKILEISQKENYPLSTITLIKIPEGEGLYYQNMNDYLKIPRITLKQTKDKQYSAGIQRERIIYHTPDSIFTIKIQDLNKATFINTSTSILVPVAIRDTIVAIKLSSLFTKSVDTNKIKEDKVDIEDKLELKIITPEYDKIYAFINLKETTLKSDMTANAYIFKFIK